MPGSLRNDSGAVSTHLLSPTLIAVKRSLTSLSLMHHVRLRFDVAEVDVHVVDRRLVEDGRQVVPLHGGLFPYVGKTVALRGRAMARLPASDER